MPVDDDERARMRLAWVPGGIRAGVFARAKGADAPTAGPCSREQASIPMMPTGPGSDRPAARNLLALPPQLRECDLGRI
jgi:hypothetical protein